MKAFYKDRFQNKVMLITGAARGIGQATALRAAREGARLILVDKREAEGLETLAEVRAAGGEAVFMLLDLSVEESASLMVRHAAAHFGRLDIAVNNAGMRGDLLPAHDLSREDMEHCLADNFLSVFYACKYELRQFLHQGDGGVIVNNGSIGGLTGLPGNPAYVAAKHAVNGLTKSLAVDYASHDIRVNSVNPAATHTPMFEEAAALARRRMEEIAREGVDPRIVPHAGALKRKTLLGRELTAEEQAASILFLASDDASHMTGSVVVTDGGWTAF